MSETPSWHKRLLDKSIDASSGLMFRGIGGAAGSALLFTIFRSVDDPYKAVLDWACVAMAIASMVCAVIGVAIAKGK